MRALDLVCDGMWLGLGTGSTAAKFVEALGARVAAGLKVLCVPTSEATRAQAERLGIPLSTLDETPHLHLTVDGADEIDDQLRLIKGGGGALLREKIVATASDQMVVIADDSKLVATLGRFPLPVEVVRFGLRRDAPDGRGHGRSGRMRRGNQAARGARAASRSSPIKAISSSIVPSAAFTSLRCSPSR